MSIKKVRFQKFGPTGGKADHICLQVLPHMMEGASVLLENIGYAEDKSRENGGIGWSSKFFHMNGALPIQLLELDEMYGTEFPSNEAHLALQALYPEDAANELCEWVKNELHLDPRIDPSWGDNKFGIFLPGLFISPIEIGPIPSPRAVGENVEQGRRRRSSRNHEQWLE